MIRCVLITGAAGFIGRYLARHFFNLGWSIIGIDTSPPENAPLLNLTAYYSLQLPHSDLAQILIQHQPDVFVHCAGRASVGLSITEPATDFHKNTVVTYEVLNTLRLHLPSSRFIFLSSAAVYGDPETLPIQENHAASPLSPYGFHKLQCEQICQEFTKIYGVPTASLRIFSAYGPGLRRQVIWDICQKAITQKRLTLQGTGKESRDFIHALDIAQAVHLVADLAPMSGETYNLASGREVTIQQLAQFVLNTLELEQIPEFDGIVPSGNPLNWQADISKLEMLGFVPAVALERGIKVFTNWCLAELIGV